MDQNPNTNSVQTPPQEGFVKKPLEQPILPTAVQVKLEIDTKKQNGFKKFYHENRFYIWAIVFGIVVISVLSFFAFRKQPIVAPKEANVSIAVQVPESVPAGSEAVFIITVTNQDTQKLVKMSLELAYPDGATYINSTPPANNLSGTLFPVGGVDGLIPGQNSAVMVKVKVTGNVNDTKTLGIKLHYEYSNFSSEFIKEQTASVSLVAPDVTLELQAPATANNSQLIVYSLKYENNSQNNISNARIVLHFPEGFVFASADPQPDSGNNIWNIGQLTPQLSGSIVIQGTFSASNPGESKTATAELQVLGNNGQFQQQTVSSPAVTAISSLPLLVIQDVENMDANAPIANPGDILTYHIRYQNNASTAATAVNIIATLDSRALDLSTLQAEGGLVNNNTITWNAASVPNLESLNPSDSGQLSFSVKVKNPATKDSSKDMTVVSSVKIKSNEYDTFLPGNQITIKISSPVALRPVLTFQSGQLPPQVGKTTTYQVSLSLTNSTNDFSNGLLTAFIPLGAGGFVQTGVNVAEANKVQFDTSTGKLTWQVGSLPAHTGQFSAPRTLQFSVRLIPSASQVHNSPTLVRNIQFTATDTFTNQQVSQTVDDIGTDSLAGDYGQKGTVEQ